MPDTDLTQLFDQAALSYRPDASTALAKVRARAVRRNRARRTGWASLGIGIVAVVAFVALILPDRPSTSATYLRISPTARVVDLLGPANGLTDVYFADATHGLALGQDCTLSPRTNTVCSLKIVRTQDAGQTWRPVGQTLHVIYPNSRASYPFIHFATNGKDGWIYGSETFVTHDGGQTLTADGPGGLVSDLSIEGNETWALSRPCPPSVPGCTSTISSTSTAGGPWRPIPGAPRLDYPYLQLFRTAPHDALLTAQATSGALFVTTDGGASWTSHLLPSLCDQLRHLTAMSANDMWALCSAATPTDDQTKELFHSVDDGKTWVLAATSSPGPGPGVGSLPLSGIVTLFTSVAPDRLLMAFDQGAAITSTDGGSTWAPQGLPASGGVQQLTFTDAQHGWAVLLPADTLYRTLDGGADWTAAAR